MVETFIAIAMKGHGISPQRCSCDFSQPRCNLYHSRV